MKKNTLVHIRVHNWDEAVRLGKTLVGHVFRGQLDATWTLSTTLERAAGRFGFPHESLRNREIVLLNTFQRRAHQFIDAPPSCDNYLEWVALMQHHGAPTRLLDFSHSFYVAAFFAMESAEQDAAVWALSTEFTMGHTSNTIGENQTILDLQQESRTVIGEYLSGDKTDACAMLVEPHRMNPRLAVQQGCFIVPGDLRLSFMENLDRCLAVNVTEFAARESRPVRRGDDERLSETHIVKITLPRQLHNEAMWDLNEMNVNATSLFPGLDGFARSLHTWFRDVV